jgi:putative ABC transport system permease protein
MADLLTSAWVSVARHRLRSLLALVGIAVGVCALTSIMSVEQAWRRAVTRFFAPMDLETVRVAMPGWGTHTVHLRKQELDQTDVEAILRQCPAVRAATLVTSRTLQAEAEGGGLSLPTYLVAADFTTTLPDEVQQGRLFTAEEVAQQAPVCLLSLKARARLFGDGAALGRYLRVSGRRFRVIGVVAGNRHVGLETDAIYLPATWTRAALQADPWVLDFPTIECFVRTQDPKAAVGQIERLMQQRIGGDGSQPFTHSLWQAREVALHARGRATAYSALAGLCALLAAGIGIASLLFISVAERSQEIGVQRALGASRPRIYGEYVLASLMLSGGGALVGAIAGVPAAAAGAFATRWEPVVDPFAGEFLSGGMGQLPKLSEVALSVSWEAVAAAVVLALLAGAAAALAPASEAAALSPALAIARRASTPRRGRQVLTCLQVAFGVVVLVVLTSYYALMDSEEKAEARRALGQDTVMAAVDPIAAMRQPVDERYTRACSDALVRAFSSAEALARLRRKTPLLADVVPYAPLELEVARGGRMTRAEVIATSAQAFDCQPELAPEARERAAESFGGTQRVAVISPQVKDSLFGGQDPVGQTLSLAGKKFTVIAVRPNRPGWSVHWVWVPMGHYAMLEPRAAGRNPSSRLDATRVEGRPIDPRRYVEALAQLRDALLPMLPKEYRKGIFLSENIPATTKQFIFQSAAVARRGAIGALAVLLVALIGLANMLLVSVHDELRETGLRRALGATRPEVFLHFLSQGVTLSVLGAGVGLALAALICGVTRSWAGMPLTVSAFWAAAGAMATVLAGALTSIAPAAVGARVQPVEALRYE